MNIILEAKKFFSLVKFSHTIFAMPFALIGFFMAIKNGHNFEPLLLLLVIGCMIFARNSAMAFNRLIDYDIDKKNKRTASREIPAGVISKRNATIFIIINSICFVTITYFINQLCFYLSPIALFLILFYSYSKRFTSFCHIILGLCLAISPIGAYIAVSGIIDIEPIIISIIVLFWVSGFDILYSLQDYSFDKKNNLNSIPSRFGLKNALNISRVLHIICSISVITLGFYNNNFIYYIAATIFITLLFYQHLLIKTKGLSIIGFAFFNINGLASIIFATILIISFNF